MAPQQGGQDSKRGDRPHAAAPDRIAICEPDAMMRHAIKAVFEEAGYAPATSKSVPGLVRLLSKTPPPVAIVDVASYKGGAAAELASRDVVPVVMMPGADPDIVERLSWSHHGDGEPFAAIVRSDVDPADLPAVAWLVRRGYSIASPTFARAARDLLRRTTLSARERQVLRMVAGGLTNAQIARELKVSGSTVKQHVAHLLRKLGLRRRIDLAAWVHTNGTGG